MINKKNNYMKIYTRQEKEEAKKKLPKPIYDFLGSPALAGLYTGIKDKLKLDLRQLMMFSEIVNTTLIGLEPQSALETNLHQLLPELSNEVTRELATDINDRIFKEAQRRLRENITNLEPAWNEEELGPKEVLGKNKLTDAEIERLAIQQEKEGWTAPVDPNEGPEGDLSDEESSQTPILAPLSGQIPISRTQSEEKGQMAGTRDVREMEEAPTDVHTTSSPLATQKLGGATIATSKEVQVGGSEYPVSSMKYQGGEGEVIKPEAPPAPTPPAQPIAPTRPRDSMDPYREQPE